MASIPLANVLSNGDVLLEQDHNPLLIVWEEADRTVAFVVQDSQARKVAVTPGPAMGDLVEIEAGLKEGDRVVLNPPESLEDGDLVTVKE